MEQVLLVTGGSRGIGAATACWRRARAIAVAVNYAANAAAADEVVREIRAGGGKAIAVQADVAREDQVLAMFEQVDAELGRLTALVNNAGVVDVTARVDEMSVARLKRMFDINVIGSIVCAREAVRRMSTRHGGGGGAIVNVSSAASRLGSPGQYVDYAAAKGAIDAFTIGLAKEVAGRRHPRQRRAAGTDRNRDPRLRRHAGPRATAGASGADAARRHGAGSGRDHRLAAVARRPATPPCRCSKFQGAADGPDQVFLGRPGAGLVRDLGSHARRRARTPAAAAKSSRWISSPW